jgi:D-alanyl-D-alanine carboxypeptidase
MALLAALLAPAAVVAALVLAGESRDGGSAAGRSPAVAGRGVPGPTLEPERPATPPGEGPAAVELAGVDAFRLTFRKPPRAGIVFDLDTGEVLWRVAAGRTLPVASLTKMMSALVVVERTTSRERVKITRAALRYSGSGVGRLPRGRRVPIEALLHGLLLPSGNDAAIALAVHVAGSEARFVDLMNRRAQELGLGCTRFVSSHGLESGNRSCAADLAALARIDMRELRIRRVVRKRNAVLRFPIKGRRLFLTTTNPLLRARYPGTLGLKTGYTDAAGRCYVGIVRRGGRMLGVVLLHSPDPSRQARKLLNAAFRFGG